MQIKAGLRVAPMLRPMNSRMKTTLLAALLGLVVAGASADTVWLSSLDLAKMRQGWGAPQKDRSIREQPLTIGGRRFDHGVGTHATSSLWVNLAGGSARFLATVGVDDAAGDARASITFKVVGDSRTLWESGVMRLGQPAKPVDVDLRGVRTLLLLVGDAGDGTGWDHADWADARFEVTGTAPRATDPPPEPAVVLTPRPGPAPRLNGAMIFGVRPGSPFLFSIAATGERPMKFAAAGLPRGLKLDPATGQITGALRERGTYAVTLKAANRHGTAKRKFRIVCGDTLALTPHLGWNSWYVWENHVTDAIMRAAADAMVSTGMKDHGYQYVNIDDCWAVKPGSPDPMLGGEPRDARGRVNANRRFPDMKVLTDYIHARGLKAGIYTSPGPLTCGGHVGAYQHEAADVRRFAEWGFDFLKYDWCSYGDIAKNPDRAALQKPYRLVGDLLKQQPRDLVFNLCGSFEGIPAALFRDGFDVYAANQLHRFGGPGHWNDPDYLLLGYLSNWQGGTAPTPLTPNEQYAHVSLWCLVAAPLIFSGDITRLDAFTLSVLTNDEVIDVDQDPLGRPGRRVAKNDDTEVWLRELEDGSRAVGLFNRGEMAAQVTARWTDLGVQGPQVVRDLWRQRDLGKFADEYAASVPRHGVVLVRLRSAR
jgi:alpha-galactosidase